ncbi:uncharacterized protein PGTG_15815 [Puccinia graminis f. sp. tritici CRL 75-36-700-3]|uniref:Uncharacterized protein n=1 Tax=Puccinia graminis f. sp. tritici (strain CRL 75-36-700-3 / race SCCL) TaxID=418459 RepID=E3KZX8_PUCGT|nr:uncharacterized protein PGTG_15815 [Puccinia graminis f. sp. tritici CRL 75-36-700-3]EFP89859.1 hypothetical protein PGTG_15815 [Puccinia graminis f. sp. tritici CRL 75-36-700-3]
MSWIYKRLILLHYHVNIASLRDRAPAPGFYELSGSEWRPQSMCASAAGSGERETIIPVRTDPRGHPKTKTRCMNISGSVAGHGGPQVTATRSERGPDCPSARQALCRRASSTCWETYNKPKQHKPEQNRTEQDCNPSQLKPRFNTQRWHIGFDTLTSAWWEQHNKKVLSCFLLEEIRAWTYNIPVWISFLFFFLEIVVDR